MDTSIPTDALGPEVLLNDPNAKQPKARTTPPQFMSKHDSTGILKTLKNIDASIRCASSQYAKFLGLNIDTDN